MKISVIMPTLNGAETIGAQLDALARQNWETDWELVVSDNGSTDRTLSIVGMYEERFPRVLIVDSSTRRGISHALNCAVASAAGDRVVYCDQDDEVGVGWLEAMARALDRHELVAGRLEHTKLNPAWAKQVRGDAQSEGLMRWRLGAYLPFAFSCTVGVSRDLHERVGGFDESFTGGAQDMDYCWRLQLQGAELQFVADAVTHYRLRHDLRGLYRQGRTYGESDVILCKKYRPLGLPIPPRPTLAALRAWVGLARYLAPPYSQARAGMFVFALGWRVGLAMTGLRARCLIP